MAIVPISTTFCPIAARPDESCGICLNQLEDDVVAHLNGDGLKHPVHQACIDIWLRVQRYCPSCMINVSIPEFNGFDWAVYAVTAVVLSNIVPTILSELRLSERINCEPTLSRNMGIAIINLLFLYLVYKKFEDRPEKWKNLPLIRALTEPSIAAFFLFPLSVVPAAIKDRNSCEQ